MGRPQEFDTTAAIRAARTVFWDQGYEDAAMPALEAATGLCRSSIYHAFGSKRGLFDAAVASYLGEIVRPRLRPMIEEPVAPDAVTSYLCALRAAIKAAGPETTSDGCLLINTGASPLADDAEIKQTIAGYCKELEAALSSGISARLPDQSRAQIERRSKVCTAMIIAAFAIARVDPAAAIGYLDLATGLASGD
jgi:AcrR family transcriptional regulator